MHSNSSSRNGSVLALVLITLVFIGFLTMALTTVVHSRARATNESIRRSQAVFAGQGALEFAGAYIWDAYTRHNGGSPGPVSTFKTFLTDTLELEDGDVLDLTSRVPDLEVPVTSLTVRRTDLPGGDVQLLGETTAEDADVSVSLSRAYRARPSEFTGLQRGALFTNNVNCIFCHARIDSVAKYSRDEYPRVKVAALDSLLLRTSSADSTIAGSLYVAGNLTAKDGTPLSTLAGTQLTGYEYDDSGQIVTDAFGDRIPVPFRPGENLFFGDPSEFEDNTDLAAAFPSAFPDTNANGKVDDDEYDAVKEDSTGSLTGGIIHQVSLGGTLGSGSLPTTGNTVEISGNGTGHTVLVGTTTAPLVIDGQVSFPGDVVVKGTVKGSGSIWTRGNIYIVGDLTYADAETSDGERIYGKAEDGSLNALGLTAGGNILIGDYLTSRYGDINDVSDRTTGNPDGAFSFALSEVALFNRREYARTQPTLPDKNGNQVENPNHDPDYVPRYYTQNDDSVVPVFLGSSSYWDVATGNWGGSEHPSNWGLSLILLDQDALPAASTTKPLAPTGDWLTEAWLKGIWVKEESARSSGDPLKIDALLYTDNSIFAMARRRSRNDGRIVLNGGLVSRDMGILAAGGLELNYDQRVAQFLKVSDHLSIELTSSVLWVK